MDLAKTGLTTSICGNGLFRLQEKLKRVKTLAKSWSKALGNSSKQVDEARKALEREALALLNNPLSIDSQTKVKGLQVSLANKLAVEEADLKQRSKVNWLKLEDSKFFSMATKVRPGILL